MTWFDFAKDQLFRTISGFMQQAGPGRGGQPVPARFVPILAWLKNVKTESGMQSVSLLPLPTITG